MKILICSDGTSSAQSAIDLGGLLARPLTAETTLLGIAERSEDEQPLRETLGTQAESLRSALPATLYGQLPLAERGSRSLLLPAQHLQR